MSLAPAMGAAEKQGLSDRDRNLQKRLRWMGTGILIAGLLAAVIINQRTAPDDGAADLVRSGTLLSGNAKRSENEMKSIGGQANVMAAEFREWFGSLWHGRRLARTLAVLSLGGSLTCFLLAQLLNYPPGPDSPPGGNEEPDRATRP